MSSADHPSDDDVRSKGLAILTPELREHLRKGLPYFHNEMFSWGVCSRAMSALGELEEAGYLFQQIEYLAALMEFEDREKATQPAPGGVSS